MVAVVGNHDSGYNIGEQRKEMDGQRQMIEEKDRISSDTMWKN
jgi:hypothetical protein